MRNEKLKFQIVENGNFSFQKDKKQNIKRRHIFEIELQNEVRQA